MTPIDPKVSANTWRKAPFAFKLSLFDLESITAHNPLTMRLKNAITIKSKLFTSGGD